MVDVREHRGRHEVAVAGDAAEKQRGTASDRVLDLTQHHRLLASVHHRTDLHTRLGAGPLLERRGLLDKPLRESLGDRRRHIDPLGAHADLTGVAEAVAGGEGGGGLHVGVLEHDERILAAEFENHPLQPRTTRFENVRARRAASGEDDELHVGSHHGLSLPLVAVHDPQDVRVPRRVERLDDRAGPRIGDQWRLLGGLEEHRVARDEGRQQRLVRHEDREVPRRDHRGDAERIEAKPARCPLVLAPHRLEARGNLANRRRIRIDGVLRLALAFRKRLAHLARDERAELVDRFAQTRLGPGEDLCSLRRREASPRPLRDGGSRDEAGDRFDRRRFDHADDLAGGGVDRGESFECRGGGGGVRHRGADLKRSKAWAREGREDGLGGSAPIRWRCSAPLRPRPLPTPIRPGLREPGGRPVPPLHGQRTQPLEPPSRPGTLSDSSLGPRRTRPSGRGPA